MKRCSVSLIIREMQIKTSHLSEWLSSINQQTKVLMRIWRKGHPHALSLGMHIGAAMVESSIELPQKIKNGSAL